MGLGRCFLPVSRLAWLAGFAILAGAELGYSQQPDASATLMGRVTAEGGPVEHAVVLLDSLRRTQTDRNGVFRFDSLSAGSHRIEVSAIGFYPLKATVQLFGGRADAAIRLTRSAQTLPELSVTGRRPRLESVGFYRRRASIRARFLERDTLLRLDSLNLVRGLSQLPGFRFINPASLDPELVSRSCRGGFVLWLNGWFVPDSDKAFFLRLTRPEDIDGIEIYEQNHAPLEFRDASRNRDGQCVIAIWDR
ncbi:MAG TPA: carboxypeptidase-like regulatory domain-containing protein [Gemmatimonadales bacterium]|nr:carboxypeptidase-like regulatory domain-containing protein [Gemmatimonadales bacterium]